MRFAAAVNLADRVANGNPLAQPILELRDLPLAIENIDRHKNHAGLHAGEIDIDHLHAIRQINAEPIARGQPRIYRTDRETLQFIAAARRVRLLLEGDEDPRPFEVWTDGRRELAEFVAAGN